MIWCQIYLKEATQSKVKKDTPNWMGKKAHAASQRATGNRGQLREGQVILPREECTNWPANTKWPALNTHIQAKQGVFIYLGSHVGRLYG